MEAKTKAKITGILDAFDAKKERAREESEKRTSDHELFLERFKEKCLTVVRPVMEEIAEALKERGHRAEVTESNETMDHDKKRIPAQIMLTFFPAGAKSGASYDRPQLSLVAKGANRVYFHESTMLPSSGGHAGSAGEFNLDEIDAGLVTSKIVTVLEQTLARG